VSRQQHPPDDIHPGMMIISVESRDTPAYSAPEAWRSFKRTGGYVYVWNVPDRSASLVLAVVLISKNAIELKDAPYAAMILNENGYGWIRFVPSLYRILSAVNGCSSR